MTIVKKVFYICFLSLSLHYDIILLPLLFSFALPSGRLKPSAAKAIFVCSLVLPNLSRNCTCNKVPCIHGDIHGCPSMSNCYKHFQMLALRCEKYRSVCTSHICMNKIMFCLALVHRKRKFELHNLQIWYFSLGVLHVFIYYLESLHLS